MITEDRQEKEKLRKQLEKEQLERKAAIKVNVSLMFIRWGEKKKKKEHGDSGRFSGCRLGEGVHTTLPQCMRLFSLG